MEAEIGVKNIIVIESYNDREKRRNEYSSERD